jgi:hypothetical protein
MPGMNGTGPDGAGPRTGWGRGRCRPPKQQTQEDPQVDATSTDESGETTAPIDAGLGGGGRGRGFGGGRGRGFGGGRGRGFGGGRGRGFGGGRGRGR